MEEIEKRVEQLATVLAKLSEMQDEKSILKQIETLRYSQESLTITVMAQSAQIAKIREAIVLLNAAQLK